MYRFPCVFWDSLYIYTFSLTALSTYSVGEREREKEREREREREMAGIKIDPKEWVRMKEMIERVEEGGGERETLSGNQNVT